MLFGSQSQFNAAIDPQFIQAVLQIRYCDYESTTGEPGAWLATEQATKSWEDV